MLPDAGRPVGGVGGEDVREVVVDAGKSSVVGGDGGYVMGAVEVAVLGRRGVGKGGEGGCTDQYAHPL